jgi:hypothetical protein
MAIIERFIIKWEITLLALEAEVVDLAQVRFYSHNFLLELNKFNN